MATDGQSNNGQLPVLLRTSLESAVMLRLCEPDSPPFKQAKAVRAVHRLVQTGRLRPVRPGKEYGFTDDELIRYCRADMERTPLAHGGDRDV